MGRYGIKLNYKRFAVSTSITCTTDSQSIQNNTSEVTIKFKVTRTSGSTYWASAKTVTFTCDGQTKTSSLALPSSKTSASCSQTFTISHNADGTKTISYKAKSADTGTSVGSVSASGSTTLPTIPRYAVITSFNVSRRDETSVQYNWSADSYCDWAWYSTDNGSTWHDLPGNNIVSGLSANTTYNFRLKVRRQDSQLTTDSENYPQTTYNYPYISSTPSFTIGNAYTISIDNPLGRNCDIRILDSSNNQMSSGTTTSGSITGFNDATSITNYYNSIPNIDRSTYKVRLIVSSLGRDTTVNGGSYSVNSTSDKPTFANFDYDDVNATTLALTGNSKTFVVGYSNIKATISTSNKAIAKNGATMSSYRFIIGNDNIQGAYSDDSAVELTINNAKASVFSVYAIDSRTLSTKVEKIPTTIVQYTDIVKNVGSSSIARNNGISEETKLTLSGSIWKGNFGSVDNAIQSVTYKYKTASQSTYTTGETTITPTVDSSGNFTFQGLIKGDTSDGFDIENVYQVVVTVTDKLSSTDYTFSLASGKPHIAYHRNGISIMGAYNTTNGGKLQIDGVPVNGIQMYMDSSNNLYITDNGSNPNPNA